MGSGVSGRIGEAGRPSGGWDRRREFVRVIFKFAVDRRRQQAGLLGLAVLEEGAGRAAHGHAGAALVADRRVQRGGVVGYLQVAAVRAAGVAGGDVEQHLGLHPVGADLAPHRGGDRGHQLLLGRVLGAVALLQVAHVLAPLGLILLGQQAELAGAQPVLERVHARARLALGRVGAALLRGGDSGVGHGGSSGMVRAGREFTMFRNISQDDRANCRQYASGVSIARMEPRRRAGRDRGSRCPGTRR